MELLVLLWLVCGVVAGMIASGKGRSFGAWFLLGLIFGPPVLLFVLIAGGDAARRERALLQDHKLRHCPACAELVRSEAIVCRHCGTDLAPPRWDIWGREIRS